MFRGSHRRCINKLGTQKCNNPKTEEKLSFEVLIGHRQYVAHFCPSSHHDIRRAIEAKILERERGGGGDIERQGGGEGTGHREREGGTERVGYRERGGGERERGG